MLAAHSEHLFEARVQTIELRLVAITDVESRAERVDEVDVVLPACLDEVREFTRVCGAVRLAPQRAMMQIVLGCVEVGVQSPARHPAEKLDALGGSPWFAVEAFDYPRKEFRLVRAFHRAQANTINH